MCRKSAENKGTILSSHHAAELEALFLLKIKVVLCFVSFEEYPSVVDDLMIELAGRIKCTNSTSITLKNNNNA